jgi:lipopolysaccharide export system permease protein
LYGILVDDQRNPKQRVTVFAERGELVDRDGATFLVLQNGVAQRQEANQRDPTMVQFDRYAFDLSQFSTGSQAVKYSIRERYLWQLLFPDPKDPLFLEQPAQFRAELHDRLIAPLYPLAFVVIAFAYLGAPRTTRQSRNMSLLGAITGVGVLRLVGFASTVFGVNAPWMLSLQYIAMAVIVGFGLYVIHRGIILEPPAFIDRIATALAAAVTRRFART